MKKLIHAKIPVTLHVTATVKMDQLFNAEQREDWEETMSEHSREDGGPDNVMTDHAIRYLAKFHNKLPNDIYESKLDRLVELVATYQVDEVVFV